LIWADAITDVDIVFRVATFTGDFVIARLRRQRFRPLLFRMNRK
jgi:hypothetical protein